jgi:serine/threonine-protein kinase
LIDNGWRTDALVRKCLAKDRQDRWQNAGDLVTELRWIEQGETGDTRASVTRRPRHLWIAGVAGAAVAAAAIIATMSLHRKSEPPTMRFSIPAPANSHFNGVFASPIVLSPDGQQVAFVVNSGGRLFLYVRTLSTSAAVQLPGTEGARSLFWSPDSKFSVLCRRYSQAHHPCRHRAAGNHEGFARHLLLRRVVGERHDRSF